MIVYNKQVLVYFCTNCLNFTNVDIFANKSIKKILSCLNWQTKYIYQEVTKYVCNFNLLYVYNGNDHISYDALKLLCMEIH